MRTNLTSHPSNEVWWLQLQSSYFFKEEQSTSGRKLVFIINTSAKLIRWSLITCRVSETSHLCADINKRNTTQPVLHASGVKTGWCRHHLFVPFPASSPLLLLPSFLSIPLHSSPFLRMTNQNQTRCRSDICNQTDPRNSSHPRRGNLYFKLFFFLVAVLIVSLEDVFWLMV